MGRLLDDDIEGAHRALRQALLWFSVTYAVWQGAALVGEASPGLRGLAAAPWALCLWRTVRLGSAFRSSPRLREALVEDERIRSSRQAAFTCGYWGLLLYVGLVFALGARWQLPVDVMARVGLTVAIVVPGLAFYLQERVANSPLDA